MAVIVQVNFPMQGPWGEEMAAAYGTLAKSINDEPGFIWKVWIENETEQSAGGIYLFEDRATGQAYVDMHTKRLAGFGITGAEFRISETNEALTALNHGRLSAS